MMMIIENFYFIFNIINQILMFKFTRSIKRSTRKRIISEKSLGKTSKGRELERERERMSGKRVKGHLKITFYLTTADVTLKNRQRRIKKNLQTRIKHVNNE